MTNKYLTKVCALLRPISKQREQKTKAPYDTKPIKENRYVAKIKKTKQRKQRGRSVNKSRVK